MIHPSNQTSITDQNQKKESRLNLYFCIYMFHPLIYKFPYFSSLSLIYINFFCIYSLNIEFATITWYYES